MANKGEIQHKAYSVLETIIDPRTRRSIVDMGWVQSVNTTADGKISVVLEVPSQLASGAAALRSKAEHALADLPGVQGAQVVLSAERPLPKQHEPSFKRGSDADRTGLEGVKTLIAIASGKGGVGKSTTTVNLALALSQQGLRVGVVDADIYGPSIPTLLGLSGKPEIVKVGSQDRFVPKVSFGIAANSIGLLIDEDTAMAWRGPMVQSALIQLLKATHWGELDVLLIDMPPGTGDIQLSLAQQTHISGAVVVSTPQDLALIDAKKAMNLFKKTEIPLLGLVENMSGYVCPNCREVSYPFGSQGVADEASAKGLAFLGSIPLDLLTREGSDSGKPILAHGHTSVAALAYRSVCAKLVERMEGLQPKLAPRLRME